MARTSSYEVYSKQGREWVLAAVCHAREPAMLQARTLLERGTEAEVQILEEVVDAAARDVVTALVFRGNRQAFLNRDARRAAAQRPTARPAAPAAAAARGVPGRVVVLAAAGAAIGAAAVTALGMWALHACV
jgi:hypothetical protein